METQKKPEQPQPQKNNTVLLVVLAVILVLAAGFAGYFIWKYYSSPKGKTTTAVTSSVPPTATTTATVTQITTSTATTTATTGSSSKATISADYIISDSNSRVISESELYNLTPWQLKVARNEIYARHGRPFIHKDLQCYFAAKNWYTENPNFSESLLSVVENKNIATILEYEKKTNSPLMLKDSGC